MSGAINAISAISADVFVAVAAIAWADGKLDPEHADAIVRAAIEAGLSLDDIAGLEASIAGKEDLDRTLDRSSMSKEDRLFVYAVAAWIARLDGVVTLNESDALAALAEARRSRSSEGTRRSVGGGGSGDARRRSSRSLRPAAAARADRVAARYGIALANAGYFSLQLRLG